VGPIFATLSCFTHTTPHSIFSQSEYAEASSSPVQLYHKYGRKHSFHWPYFTCLYPQLQWIHKIHASQPSHRPITVTSITRILRRLYSLALLLSLSLVHRRLRNHGTPAMALGLKSINYSSPGARVTFSQTLSSSQTLSHSLLLLSSSPTLKQTPLKSSLSLKGLCCIATVLQSRACPRDHIHLYLSSGHPCHTSFPLFIEYILLTPAFTATV
jgi:hypothetical protein